MAKIRMLVSMAGEDFSWAPGEVVEADDGFAAALCSDDGGAPRARRVDDDEPTSAELRAAEAARQADAEAADRAAQAAVDAERAAAAETAAEDPAPGEVVEVDDETALEEAVIDLPETTEGPGGKRRRR